MLPRWLIGPALMAAIGGCASFDSDEALADMVPTNACRADVDCATGSRCREDICVTSGTTQEQFVALQITPAYQADGTDPIPIQTEMLRLDGPTTREFKLPRPVPITVKVRHEGEPVSAAVRVRVGTALPGVTTRPLSAVLPEGQGAVNLVLNEGSQYVIRVEPTDTSLPPLTRTIDSVQDGMETTFEYTEETFTRRYLVLGEPDGPPMLVRALDPETRRLMSSVETTGESDVVTLIFGGEEDAPYILELSPPTEAKAELVAESDNDCAISAISPSYQVNGADLDDGDLIQVVLPQVLSPIRYEGEVELCGNGDAVLTTENAQTLGVSLRSTALVQREGAEPTPVVATYVVETATRIEDGTHRFCATALPGMYEVVVNPPAITGNCLPEEDVARCGCGIFAETRALEPSEEYTNAEPVLLTLPTMASISGALTTGGETPVVGATIEASALPARSTINLGDYDRGVTGYNRSVQGTSGMGGRFRVPLDVGAYDVTIKPPAESGFAWLVVRDVLIASRSAEFSQMLTMGAPISVNGTLSYKGASAGAQASLAGAVIRAYGIVDESGGGSARRAVQLGQTTADEDGSFMLLLSPVPRQGWWIP